MQKIYFAGGCFWGVEEYFSRIPGVCDTECGYANGDRGKSNVRGGLLGHHWFC